MNVACYLHISSVLYKLKCTIRCNHQLQVATNHFQHLLCRLSDYLHSSFVCCFMINLVLVNLSVQGSPSVSICFMCKHVDVITVYVVTIMHALDCAKGTVKACSILRSFASEAVFTHNAIFATVVLHSWKSSCPPL